MNRAVWMALLMVAIAFSGCAGKSDNGDTQDSDPTDPVDPSDPVDPVDPVDPECEVDCEPCVEDCDPCTENCGEDPEIPNEPPIASFTFATEDREVTVDASNSADPEGEPLSYQWRWGDGNKGSGRIAKYTYAADGNWTVTLIVSDTGGAQNETTRLVRVVQGEINQGECKINCGTNPFAEEKILQPEHWFLHHEGGCETDVNDPFPGYYMSLKDHDADDDGCAAQQTAGIPGNEITVDWIARDKDRHRLFSNGHYPAGSTIEGVFYARLDNSLVGDIRFSLIQGQNTVLGSVSTLELYQDDPLPEEPTEWDPTKPSDPNRPYPFVVSPPLSGQVSGNNFEKWEFHFPLDKAVTPDTLLTFRIQIVGANTIEIGYDDARTSKFVLIPPPQ